MEGLRGDRNKKKAGESRKKIVQGQLEKGENFRENIARTREKTQI